MADKESGEVVAAGGEKGGGTGDVFVEKEDQLCLRFWSHVPSNA